MWMSWILDVLIDKYGFEQYKSNYKTHSFVFSENNSGYYGNNIYKNRVYVCKRCSSQLLIYLDLVDNEKSIKKAYFGIEDRIILSNKTCNQIIMEKACV